MRTGVIVSLGASAVLGLGALVVAKVWLPQPGHGAAPGAASAAGAVPVVVARSAIPYGGKLDAANLMVERLPAGDAPDGAYSSTAQLLAQPGGAPIALTPIAARAPVLSSQLSGAGAKDTVAAVIGEGMRAYTIAVSDVAGVGGHVMPGDRVDVVLTRELPAPPARNGTPVCGQCKRLLADVVLQDVRVLGMDLNADPSSTKAAVAHTATLEVTVEDAEKLAVAAQAGSLSLALRRTGNAEISPVQAMDVADLGGLGPSRPARAVQVASRKPAGAERPALIRTHAVTVFNGDAPTSIQVPAEAFGPGAL